MGLWGFSGVTWVWIALAVAVHGLMFRFTAPFGRHTSTHWGPVLDNRLAWFLMESVSLGLIVWFWWGDGRPVAGGSWILFLLWTVHYGNRALVFPLRIRSAGRTMPVIIMLFAVGFNLVNAGLNGYYLKYLAPAEDYGRAWLTSPHFIAGAALFATGLFINLKSDHMLIHLRKPGESGYVIPRGFLFEYVSSPNLFGEIIEWGGFALMAWNLPALSFFLWTLANLVPRAKNHHDWYLRRFPEYPKNRKRVFPFIF